MSDLFKNLFSQRQGLLTSQPVIVKNTISQDVINAIGSGYDLLCRELKSVYNRHRGYGALFLQEDIEREIWIHFANRRLNEFGGHGSHYYLVFDELLTHNKLPWNRILDLVEFVCKWISVNTTAYLYLENLLKEFESYLNQEFERLDYGYRIVNHCVTDIVSNEEVNAINEAINNSEDNVSRHLQSAVKHYSSRPNPDVRNSIKESISAVEAVCRDLTGEDTLGKALKHLEDNGVVIHKMLKDEFTKFYVYTNDPGSGIRHALMDADETYVPSLDEAYYMLVSCSAFINYLRRKAAP